LQLVHKNVRTFPTTSVGRLFDTTAALLGFTRDITFEGQAAMWVEHMARAAGEAGCYPFPFLNGELDFRPLLLAVAMDRIKGRNITEIARAFQCGIAHGVSEAARELARSHNVNVVVLSGGVFQNELLLEDLKAELGNAGVQLWTNQAVPANDGGISLGQAAFAFFEGMKNK
jgi:hydrogenase maturation protein HypF